MPKNTVKTILVILGPPGSGKGTQGKLLAPLLDFHYVSMGQVLRNYVSRGTPLGLEIKALIDNGKIIPDEMIRIIFHEIMMELPAKPGVILDGFPRDLSQEPIFEEAFSEFGIESVKVLFIDVPEEKLLSRITKRGGVENRADDDPEVVHTRFIEYQQKTLPLRKYYEEKGYLIPINGDQDIQSVHREILVKLGIVLNK